MLTDEVSAAAGAGLAFGDGLVVGTGLVVGAGLPVRGALVVGDADCAGVRFDGVGRLGVGLREPDGSAGLGEWGIRSVIHSTADALRRELQ